jgi:CubicO group peptidase (beta-lactamase class C family)
MVALLGRSAVVVWIVACVVACDQRAGGGVPFAAPPATDAAGYADAQRTIAVRGIGRDPKLDRIVARFMKQNAVPNAELAYSKAGTLVFSHAYTYRGLAKSTTMRGTMIRLASLTKAWTSAALYDLLIAGKIRPSQKVFRYLGITQPLPVGAPVDPRVYDITIEDMIQHESGWDDAVSHYDPTFSMRRTAKALGLDRAITQVEEVRYQLHEPLQEKPGTTYAYCNFCYTVLGMVVAKASGMTYQEYMTNVLDKEVGVDNVQISPTVGARLPKEVAHYYNPYFGRSAVYITSKKMWGWPYSGDGLINEVAEGAGGLATNAESMLALMNRYDIAGVGTPPPYGEAASREGEMPGANTFAEQLPNGINFSLLVNTNAYAYGANPYAFITLIHDVDLALLP